MVCRNSTLLGVASWTWPPPPASLSISPGRAASEMNRKQSSSSRANGRNSPRQAGQAVPRKRVLAGHRATSVCRPASKWGSGLDSSSAVVIIFAQRNPNFTGKIYQRDGERAERNHEEDGD